MTSNTDAETTDSEHRLKAYEAIWVLTEIEPDPTGDSDVTIVDETIQQAVEELEHAWEYECECGAEFDTYAEGVEHLKETIPE